MKKRILCLVLTVFLSLSIFNIPLYAETNLSSPSISLNAEQTLEAYVKVLCSDAFGGRKTGSFGNNLTIDWLIGMLEGIGIAPYENDYKMGFTTRCYNHETQKMAVYEKSGEVKTLVSGKDFYISLTGNFEVKLTKDSVSFLSIGDTSQVKNADYTFKEVHAFNGGSFLEKRTPQPIQVTGDIFRYLMETDIEYIHIVNEVTMESKEVYNVVGVIPGTNREKAVVLSAHFDHMGQLGESIFRGAMDNASGTAALLYIAEELSKLSEESPFDFDIVIAFCNDEENGINGSASLAPTLRDAYENLFNINIDCVGIGGTDNVYVLSDTVYRTLVDDMKLYMDKYDILYNDDDTTFTYLASDGVNFEKNNIPSVSFIGAFIDGEVLVDFYHTPLDTDDRLNYSQIANLCEMIVEFVADNGSKLYEERTRLNVNVNVTYLPDNIATKFSNLVKKVKSGEEAHFDEELVSHMLGQIILYTYDDYLQISEGISILREYGDYHLGFIQKPRTLPITRLIYVRDVPLPEANVIQISLATYFAYNSYKLSPIEGMDGYFVVSPNSAPDMILGFIYEGDDRKYFFEIGYLIQSSNYVSLMISPNWPNAQAISNLDHLKLIINDLKVEEFVERWKEYNLQ